MRYQALPGNELNPVFESLRDRQTIQETGFLRLFWHLHARFCEETRFLSPARSPNHPKKPGFCDYSGILTKIWVRNPVSDSLRDRPVAVLLQKNHTFHFLSNFFL
jgi:hypothetical protein